MEKREPHRPVKNPRYPGEEEVTPIKKAEIAYDYAFHKGTATDIQIEAALKELKQKRPDLYQEYLKDGDNYDIPYYLPPHEASEDMLMKYFS